MKKKLLLAILIVILVIGITFIIRNSGKDVVNSGVVVQDQVQEQAQDSNQYTQTSLSSGIGSSILSQHNSQNDCWISYDGKVYDITSWLPKHPGGIDRILPYCGTADEFQNAFRKKHGTSKVSLLMQVGTFMGDFDKVGTLD